MWKDGSAVWEIWQGIKVTKYAIHKHEYIVDMGHDKLLILNLCRKKGNMVKIDKNYRAEKRQREMIELGKKKKKKMVKIDKKK